MNPQQQQQMMMAQQMAAQQRQAQIMASQQQQGAQPAGGAYMSLQQQQSLAFLANSGAVSAEKMQMLMARHQSEATRIQGGQTPEAMQQQMLAQQMAAQYGGGVPAQAAPAGAQYQQAPYGQPAAANPYAGGAPAYAAPAAPAGDGTMVSVTFPDGCMIGWDRLRNELFLNGKLSNTKMKQLPARPSPEFSALTGAIQTEGPAIPVEKSGMMTKLGWKKSVIGSESWQTRFFRLSDTTLSYAKDSSSPPLNVITLNNGVTVCVVTADTPAQNNR